MIIPPIISPIFPIIGFHPSHEEAKNTNGQPTTNPTSNHGLSNSEIAAISVSAAAVLFMLVLFLYCCRRERKRDRQQARSYRQMHDRAQRIARDARKAREQSSGVVANQTAGMVEVASWVAVPAAPYQPPIYV